MPDKRPHPDSAKADIRKKIEEAQARAAEVKARFMVKSANASRAATPTPPTSTPAPAVDKIAEAKARLAAAKARIAAATQATQAVQAPQPSMSGSAIASSAAPFGAEPRGGLSIGLHPMLMGDISTDSRANGKQAMAPKFATTMANRRTESPVQRPGKDKRQLDLSGPNLEELKKNPYYDTSLGGQSAVGRPHKRQLVFNQHGKYIQQANALRRQKLLEDMKKRIAEQARKVGLEEADNEKALLIEAPPDIEWWDEGFINGKDYEDLDAPGKLKIEGDGQGNDSLITRFIQHPVLIAPPQEKLAPAPKPMYLTKKEQAKLRRQRRMAEHKEQQAKIRLGLEPPPPPKVKKSNLMRVLGEQAVKDPTAVEARVNREIAERRMKHEQENAERQLTKEEKAEKLARQQEADAAKGIHCCVFKVDNLSFGKHRYQVDIFAKEYALTGIVILNPKQNLVIVEGGEHSIKHYKKAMLNRIKWTENAMPSSVREGNKEAEAQWLQSVDEEGNLKDLSLNKCTLIWEGAERQRAFRKWGSRVCEMDAEAKEALSRAKMENMWTLAKSIQ